LAVVFFYENHVWKRSFRTFYFKKRC